MFRLFKDSAVVSRLVYTSNKSTLLPTWNTYKGYLKPLKPDDSLYQWAFGKDFSFTTVKNADIQEWDRLVINSVEYNVKWIAEWNGLTVQYRRLLLVKK